MYYAAGLTDIGVTRSQNQDTIFVCNQPIGALPNLFMVADGMGGHRAGDVASRLAVDKFSEFVRNFHAQDFVQPENYLEMMVSAAQNAGDEETKKAESDEAMQGMGTTLTACVLANEKAFIAHISDSRAYTVSLLGMKQLTSDHTYVNELVQMGKLSEEEAKIHPKRNVLTKVLGVPGNIEVDCTIHNTNDAAAILLCSDGLTNMVDEESMMNIINGLGYVENRVGYLIKEANKRGGHDNISAVLIDVGR
jgi:protein phosphatase